MFPIFFICYEDLQIYMLKIHLKIYKLQIYFMSKVLIFKTELLHFSS